MSGLFNMSFDFKQNYFELFSLPLQFEVDAAALSEKYRELQKVVHPDRYADKGEHEQRTAVQASSHINMAMDTLKHPLSRVTYILSLQGIDLLSETDTKMDHGFLFKQMEWREAIEDLVANDEAWDALDKLSEEVQQERRSNLSALCVLIDQEDWAAARGKVRQLQFIEKMLSEILDKEAAIEE